MASVSWKVRRISEKVLRCLVAVLNREQSPSELGILESDAADVSKARGFTLSFTHHWKLSSGHGFCAEQDLQFPQQILQGSRVVSDREAQGQRATRQSFLGRKVVCCYPKLRHFNDNNRGRMGWKIQHLLIRAWRGDSHGWPVCLKPWSEPASVEVALIDIFSNLRKKPPWNWFWTKLWWSLCFIWSSLPIPAWERSVASGGSTTGAPGPDFEELNIVGTCWVLSTL